MSAVRAAGWRHDPRFWGSVGVAATVGLVVFLLLAPGGSAGGSFSGQMKTLGANCVEPCSAENVTEVIPAGANVTVRWSDPSGGTVVFQIAGLTWYDRVSLVCQQIGTN